MADALGPLPSVNVHVSLNPLRSVGACLNSDVGSLVSLLLQSLPADHRHEVRSVPEKKDRPYNASGCYRRVRFLECWGKEVGGWWEGVKKLDGSTWKGCKVGVKVARARWKPPPMNPPDVAIHVQDDADAKAGADAGADADVGGPKGRNDGPAFRPIRVALPERKHYDLEERINERKSFVVCRARVRAKKARVGEKKGGGKGRIIFLYDDDDDDDHGDGGRQEDSSSSGDEKVTNKVRSGDDNLENDLDKTESESESESESHAAKPQKESSFVWSSSSESDESSISSMEGEEGIEEVDFGKEREVQLDVLRSFMGELEGDKAGGEKGAATKKDGTEKKGSAPATEEGSSGGKVGGFFTMKRWEPGMKMETEEVGGSTAEAGEVETLKEVEKEGEADEEEEEREEEEEDEGNDLANQKLINNDELAGSLLTEQSIKGADTGRSCAPVVENDVEAGKDKDRESNIYEEKQLSHVFNDEEDNSGFGFGFDLGTGTGEVGSTPKSENGIGFAGDGSREKNDVKNTFFDGTTMKSASLNHHDKEGRMDEKPDNWTPAALDDSEVCDDDKKILGWSVGQWAYSNDDKICRAWILEAQKSFAINEEEWKDKKFRLNKDFKRKVKKKSN